MLDKKISLLVNKQVPGFIRDEYPKFISFLEAYYEFLENEQFTGSVSQKNDIQNKIDFLRNLSDIDVSLDTFEEHFFNSFLPYLPKETAANKDLIIKNIMPLYLEKGSEKSFKLLFRMLFDADVTLNYPKDNILRASDGRWVIENILRVSDIFYSEYVYDGTTTTYFLPEVYATSDIAVTINGIETTNFLHYVETKKLVLQESLTNGDVVRISYLKFNTSLLVSRRLIGKTSNAVSIIEKITESKLGDFPFFELFINEKTKVGNFLRNEVLEFTVVSGDNLITINCVPYSDLKDIVILNGGASYNIGDPIIIYGNALEDAIAVIDDVTSGLIEDLIIADGGVGFKVNNNITAVGYATNSFSATVQTVDSSGTYSSNTVSFSPDIIFPYLNIAIDNPYGFPANVNATNTAIISETLQTVTITDLGPITSVNVAVSTITSTLNPSFEITPVTVTGDITLKDLGIIGEITILDGGQNYTVGDQIYFNNTLSYSGQGANAFVRVVDDNGAITQVHIVDGGIGYSMQYPPTLTVSSGTGSGASLAVSGIMGDGESLLALLSDGVAGRIRKIKIIYPGLNYSNTPTIHLSGFGNGQATAEAQLSESYTTIPGRWTTSDGKLSNRDINLQGRDYFIDFSYVITSQVEFKKYKEILKNLLHPAGLKPYARYSLISQANVQLTNIVDTEITLGYSGRVSVTNGSVVITGSNTGFDNVSSNVIVINNETRNVITVDSSTSMNVDVAFTSDANNQLIKIIT
jgi:hypothetical protein